MSVAPTKLCRLFCESHFKNKSELPNETVLRALLLWEGCSMSPAINVVSLEYDSVALTFSRLRGAH